MSLTIWRNEGYEDKEENVRPYSPQRPLHSEGSDPELVLKWKLNAYETVNTDDEDAQTTHVVGEEISEPVKNMVNMLAYISLSLNSMISDVEQKYVTKHIGVFYLLPS